MFRLLLPAFLILAVVACKKDDDSTDPCAKPLSESPLSACLEQLFFDTGSYWVYQNAQTLELDSTWASATNNSWYEESGHPRNCPRMYRVQLASIDYQSSRREDFTDGFLYDQMTASLNHPLENNHIIKYLCNGGVIAVDLADTTYTEAYRSTPTDSTEAYVVPGVGTVRYIEYGSDTAIFDLIRHKVLHFKLDD